MTFLQGYLLACGAFSVAAGVAFMLFPQLVTSAAGLELTSTTAVIDVQGFYGGQIFGMGLAMLAGWRSARFVVPALVLIVAAIGGTALGRLYGVAASGECPATIMVLLVVEVATALVAAMLLARELRAAPQSPR